jgi:hypothetical protein
MGSIATGLCRRSGREVRFGPKTGLILSPNPVVLAPRLLAPKRAGKIVGQIPAVRFD